MLNYVLVGAIGAIVGFIFGKKEAEKKQNNKTDKE